MRLINWLRLNRASRERAGRCRSRAPRYRGLFVERLEDRDLLTSYTISGLGVLCTPPRTCNSAALAINNITDPGPSIAGWSDTNDGY